MTSGDAEQFRRLCHELAAPQLAGHGFLSAGERREEEGGLRQHSLVFRRTSPGSEPHYLLVQLVTIPCHDGRDIGWVQVLLGEGSHEGIDSYYNSTSIWDVTKAVTGGVDTTGYSIRTGDTPAPALTFAAGELLAHAADFLAGDLSAFRSTRARQNAEPRTYPATMCDLEGQPLDEAGRRSLIERLEALRRIYC